MVNSLGNLVLLPFQGQQIWDATFCGRNLTMKSIFTQPYPTHNFLATYGGFLLHCGATAMGVPSQKDTHPLHGDLSNAIYNSATLVFGNDGKGEYIGLTGTYQHIIAFNCNYTATPLVKLYSSSSVFSVSMIIHNLRKIPMPLMVLEHVNFRPVNYSRLAQTVFCDPDNMKVRLSVPEFMQSPPGYIELLNKIKKEPELHLVIDPKYRYDPEIVIYLNYLADKNGWAHTMQIHPDGSADILRHKPEQMNHGIRWLCRTSDYDAIGVEPATAQVDGYTAEKEKGNLRFLDGLSMFTFELEIGTLSPEEAIREEELIKQVLSEKQDNRLN
ncbi:MAG: DUF4432 family protein [Anaerolineaceae bacterium]|nr:DUF4432 family protein [Anaerolineaceae bacterium]